MSGVPTQAQQQEYLNSVRQQLQVQMIQDLTTKVTDNCFRLCATKRGVGMDSSEKSCMGNCMERYMETMNVVKSSLESRS